MAYEQEENSENKIKRRMKKKQLERNVRKGQIGIERFRAFVRFVSILFLIFLAYKALKFHGWYINKSIFNTPENKYLKIYNNQITPDYKILTALRQTPIPNHPIYMINPKIFEENIKKLPPVERVFIKRYFYPARLYVYIKEREPIFTISPDENVAPIAFFTSDGKLINKEYMPLPADMKTYLLLSYGNKGDDYSSWSKEKVLNLYTIAKFIEKETDQKVIYIDLRTPTDIYVQLDNIKLRIGELNNTLMDRLVVLSKLDEITKNVTQPIKYIDLSWDDSVFIKHENSSVVETPPIQ